MRRTPKFNWRWNKQDVRLAMMVVIIVVLAVIFSRML